MDPCGALTAGTGPIELDTDCNEPQTHRTRPGPGATGPGPEELVLDCCNKTQTRGTGPGLTRTDLVHGLVTLCWGRGRAHLRRKQVGEALAVHPWRGVCLWFMNDRALARSFLVVYEVCILKFAHLAVNPDGSSYFSGKVWYPFGLPLCHTV